ncbi:hypothetical protein M422DRAFT_239402 [Sphaerobolus stellatus SS14]|nr:hypothetical protein M422DRAFT_239402 [Sphaerobolus stellatus SS14]
MRLWKLLSLLSNPTGTKLHSWATVSPLLGAIFAPFSVLFDIPALTEPWFIKFDPNLLLDPNKANSIPDKLENVVLSAAGLGFNIIANVLLVVRFSTSTKWWRTATKLSVVSWVLKTPITPTDRIVFVLYSLLAVPIMASFAIKAVQQVFGALSNARYNRHEAELGSPLRLYASQFTRNLNQNDPERQGCPKAEDQHDTRRYKKIQEKTRAETSG